MEIVELKVMNGPNYWSVTEHKLIVIRMDVSAMDNYSGSSLQSIVQYMEASLPGISDLHALRHFAGEPVSREWAGHALAIIALYLQQKAGLNTNYYSVRPEGTNDIIQVSFSYEDKEAGRYAGKAAAKVLDALLSFSPFDLEKIVEDIRDLREEPLGPSTRSIVEEAIKRNIPYKRWDCGSFIMFGQGAKQKKIQASICDSTSNIAVDLAGDKEATKELLEKALIPVPKGMVIRDEEKLEEAIKYLHFPLVVKPINGNHGRGITTNIDNRDDLLEAFRIAKTVSRSVIVEQFITGNDFRLLLINFKLIAAAKRTPAEVTGDGRSTIQQLVDIENQDPKRGEGHSNLLTKITIDGHTLQLLEAQGLHPGSVLPEGVSVYLKDTANLSTGGTAIDITDSLHPDNVYMAERIARIIGLDVCGIDIMAPDLSTPLSMNGGAVIEVNAAPGLRMHISPTHGKARNVAGPIMDMLYPNGESARIPIVGVTGTNGKTTTTRLMAHLARSAGHSVGFTSTDGIYIKDKCISKGDSSGPKSAGIILGDPAVDFAVLECARGGMLRSGLAFDHCDVAIVTNVAADHLGLKGINTVQDMAKVKSVLPCTVFPHGYAILNADDDLVYAMREGLKCNVAFFSMDPESPRIRMHQAQGGVTATVENGYITIRKGMLKKEIEKTEHIPITFSGRATFMVQNVLAATLAAMVCDFSMENIKLGLQTFFPTPEQTPGRLNIFRFKNFEVMVDYAHNPHGFMAIKSFVDNTPADHKVGIIAGTGDRRPEDITELGRLAATMFDEVVVRQDTDLRGSTREHIESCIKKGLEMGGCDNIKFIPDEKEAVAFVIENAKPGSFITICSEHIESVVELLKEYQKEEKGVVA
jgi:cyanophycin synthetase